MYDAISARLAEPAFRPADGSGHLGQLVTAAEKVQSTVDGADLDALRAELKQTAATARQIAAAAPHRAEAFQACQAMIDRLKQRAPIWKKEFSPDGSSWVGLGP